MTSTMFMTQSNITNGGILQQQMLQLQTKNRQLVVDLQKSEQQRKELISLLEKRDASQFISRTMNIFQQESIEDVKAQNMQLKQQTIALKQQVQDSASISETNQARVERQDQQIEELNEKIQEYQLQLKKMIANAKKVQQLNRQQHSDLEQYKLVHQQMQDELNLSKEMMEAYGDIQISFDGEKQKYEGEILNLKMQLEQANSTIAQQQQQIQQLQNQFLVQQTQFACLTQNLNATNAQIQQLPAKRQNAIQSVIQKSSELANPGEMRPMVQIVAPENTKIQQSVLPDQSVNISDLDYSQFERQLEAEMEKIQPQKQQKALEQKMNELTLKQQTQNDLTLQKQHQVLNTNQKRVDVSDSLDDSRENGIDALNRADALLQSGTDQPDVSLSGVQVTENDRARLQAELRELQALKQWLKQ